MPISTVSNAKIGLKSNGGSGDIDTPTSVFKFLAGKKEAPIPKQTVGKAQSLREKILVLSIFPDIYTRSKK